MDQIERRLFMKGAAGGALACSMNGLLTSGARAQSAPPRAAAWPNRRLLDLLKIEHPIIQAPMGGHVGPDMAVAVSAVGGLGSIPAARSSAKQVRDHVANVRSRTHKPVNLNFFCHAPPRMDEAIENAWRRRFARYYTELGVEPSGADRGIVGPFNAEICDTVVELRPEIVSFHFGLPEASLVKRVKDAGCVVLSSATTVAEARWLEEHGADAIIAQGAEAGGHRAMFLATDVASQVGTFALVPQVVDAVKVPVIAAGGIADGRGIAAAFALGAAGVQCGTAYLLCPEAVESPQHRAALKSARDDGSAITTIFTGRPARSIINRVMRELGPLPEGVPQFPLASAAVWPLMLKAEAQNSGDFTALWSGQAAALCRELPARDLTLKLASEALEKLGALRG